MNHMIDMKKLLAKILSYMRINNLRSSTELHPAGTGWTVTYTSIPGLRDYSTIYIRVHVYGLVTVVAFPRFTTDHYSQTITDTYYANGTYTYGRLLITVDWENEQVGISAVNGATDQMGIQGIWGTNKL